MSDIGDKEKKLWPRKSDWCSAASARMMPGISVSGLLAGQLRMIHRW
nr:hypothetical protein [Marinicella sp. W31]MDC2877753.1 hypothetical protein [Marinicella sp. W31]